jgi:hypothetical protein
MIKMKLQIITDGAVEGWFVALCTTITVYTLIVMGFFWGVVRDAWPTMKGVVETVYPLTFGAWLAYKAAKAIGGK